jgi:hypothetical protein
MHVYLSIKVGDMDMGGNALCGQQEQVAAGQDGFICGGYADRGSALPGREPKSMAL